MEISPLPNLLYPRIFFPSMRVNRVSLVYPALPYNIFHRDDDHAKPKGKNAFDAPFIKYKIKFPIFEIYVLPFIIASPFIMFRSKH